MILQGKLTCRELSSLRVERGLIENIMTTAQVSEFKQKLLLYKFATKFATWLGTDLSKEQAITIVIYVKMTTFSLEEAN